MKIILVTVYRNPVRDPIACLYTYSILTALTGIVASVGIDILQLSLRFWTRQDQLASRGMASKRQATAHIQADRRIHQGAQYSALASNICKGMMAETQYPHCDGVTCDLA
jgi:hypothetical protein